MLRSAIALLYFVFTTVLLPACSGPSEEELRRMQMLQAQRAEEAARQQQLEAEEKEMRISQRQANAEKAWQQKTSIRDNQINALFNNRSEPASTSESTRFKTFDLQPSKYNYAQSQQRFTLVGMRNLPDSTAYSPIFPDESASYQPGQKAKSVLEFSLLEETVLNRIGQSVLKKHGQRWVAATLNFKRYDLLKQQQPAWSWTKGLFEDITWKTTPESAYPHIKNRDVKIQLGFRFCVLKDSCYLDSDYRGHPTRAIRADIMSIVIGNRKTGEILATFVNPDA